MTQLADIGSRALRNTGRLGMLLAFSGLLGCLPAAERPGAGEEPAPLGYGLERIPNDAENIGRVTLRQLERGGYTKMARVAAPGGGFVHIVAQEGVADLAVARARNLLRFFLHPVPGSTFGTRELKAAVADELAVRGAVLAMPTGADREGNEPRFYAQPLYESETPIEGSPWYTENNWDHRDAAFEEIFHMVHDDGIGTDEPGALPDYQAQIVARARTALEQELWGRPVMPRVPDWIRELEAEGSIAQEYIAAAIDSYYGLWAAYTERPGGMWGIYAAKTRADMERIDPEGLRILESFLPPMLEGYEALVDPQFRGTFSLVLDEALPWTHKSQYLVEVTLTGSKPSGLEGNTADNVLRGNAGDNHIDGGPGRDVAVFSGPRARYAVSRLGHALVVSDSQTPGDARDLLVSVETLRFADGEVPADEVAQATPHRDA